jgi:hypothetical protein
MTTARDRREGATDTRADPTTRRRAMTSNGTGSTAAMERVMARMALPLRAALSDEHRRRWDYHAAVAEAQGYSDCGGPAYCGPCAAAAWLAWVERQEADRKAAIEQHAVSRARLAQRPVSPRVARMARDAAFVEATRRIGGAGARCVVCRVDHADGSKSCRSCGVETTDADLGPFLDTLNGRARADRSPEHGSSGGAGGVGRRRSVSEEQA